MLLLQAFLIPVEEFLDTGLYLYLVGPAEAVELVYGDEFARSAVGLGGVELDFAFEAYGVSYQFGEFTDGELLAGAYIDVAVADFSQ